MRDYTQHFYCVDSNPIGPFGFQSHYFFDTMEEAQSFFDSFAGSSPGGGTLTAPMPVWWRWNKKFMTGWLNSAFVQNLDPAGGAYIESPRKFGINSAAEKRVSVPRGDFTAKKSDFSGAGGLITFVNSLPAYAAILKREGRARDAGIVLFVYNQIISQQLSITDGLKILRDNNL
jgi:hypothetical protein